MNAGCAGKNCKIPCLRVCSRRPLLSPYCEVVLLVLCDTIMQSFTIDCIKHAFLSFFPLVVITSVSVSLSIRVLWRDMNCRGLSCNFCMSLYATCCQQACGEVTVLFLIFTTLQECFGEVTGIWTILTWIMVCHFGTQPIASCVAS